LLSFTLCNPFKAFFSPLPPYASLFLLAAVFLAQTYASLPVHAASSPVRLHAVKPVQGVFSPLLPYASLFPLAAVFPALP